MESMRRHQQSVDSQGIVDLDENCFSNCLYTPLVGIGVNVSFQLFLLMLRRFIDIPPHSCFIRRFRPEPISHGGVRGVRWCLGCFLGSVLCQRLYVWLRCFISVPLQLWVDQLF